jgi:hypothetical protein
MSGDESDIISASRFSVFSASETIHRLCEIFIFNSRAPKITSVI